MPAVIPFPVQPRGRTGGRPWPRIDFAGIARAALPRLDEIMSRWLPDGRRQGAEWVALNPKRGDRSAGSFKVNLRTGRWSDFATGDSGGDVIALASFLFDLSSVTAAKQVAAMLGVPYER